MIRLEFALRAILCLIFLLLPLAAQSLSRLRLEQSADLQTWQSIAVTSEMIDAKGRIVVYTDDTQRQFRIQLEADNQPNSNPPHTSAASILNRLRLEQSVDLKVWENVAVAPAMIDTNGRLVLTASTGRRFYRMQIESIQAPEISAEPVSTAVINGSAAVLTVTANGDGPFTYQWYQGAVGTTTNPVGTNSASFTTPALSSTRQYWVRITSGELHIDSRQATVTVVGQPPVEFALIPAGTYTMGHTYPVEIAPNDWDAPTVSVAVSTLYIGRHEVTKALWDEVRSWALANGYNDLAEGAGKAPNHPVQNVSWWDVIKWCNARSEREGLSPCYSAGGIVMKNGTTIPSVNWAAGGYRLPTEAEWEKAARAGLIGLRYPTGTNLLSHSLANYFGASEYTPWDLSNDYHQSYNNGIQPYTSPVGSFEPNAYGLYDMAGNVYEWCWDRYGQSSYIDGTVDPRGAALGGARTVRGGSWNGSSGECLSFARTKITPSAAVNDLGFRITKNLSLSDQAAPRKASIPSAITVSNGQSSRLTVSSDGTGPFNYQWYQGNVGDVTKPVGENHSSYTSPNITNTAIYWVRVANSAGTTDTAACTILAMPDVTDQPASRSIVAGGTATLSVSASGSDPLSYQWYQGPVGVVTHPVGTNSATFTTPSLFTTTNYWVRVSNSVGSVNSLSSTILCSPIITSQPANQTIISGNTATLTVASTGSPPMTYQWYQGAVGTTTTPVGENSASFTTPALTTTTSYWVRVSNAAGSVDSVMATLKAVSVPADLALIPAGVFQMGVTSGDTDWNAPDVSVTVSDFYIGKNEVTKALWDEVRAWAAANGYTDLATGAGKASNHPVQAVSWWDVIKWCNARSQKEGLTPVYTASGAVMKTGTTAPTVSWSANGYRLPTEAEWEKAARGGVSGKRFPWGTDTISHSQANFWNGGSEAYKTGTTGFHPTYATGSTPYTSPVGSFAANGYGLHDMAGNVSEWCWDWNRGATYVNGATDPRGAASGSYRVLRGGSWLSNALYCRAADRGSSSPSSQNFGLGLRVARSSVP